MRLQTVPDTLMACSMFKRQSDFCRAIIVVLFCALCSSAGYAQDPWLADAVENKQPKLIAKLFVDKVDVNDAQVDGMTALHWAVFYDDAPLVKKLLGRAADADLKNRYGVTALHIACQNGNAEIVKALLEAGADANQEKNGGETPLMTAARTGKLCRSLRPIFRARSRPINKCTGSDRPSTAQPV